MYVSNVLAPLAVCRCRAAMPICVLMVQNSATMMPSRPITAWLDREGVWHEGCLSSKQGAGMDELGAGLLGQCGVA